MTTSIRLGLRSVVSVTVMSLTCLASKRKRLLSTFPGRVCRAACLPRPRPPRATGH